jgi:hypothetical protein
MSNSKKIATVGLVILAILGLRKITQAAPLPSVNVRVTALTVNPTQIVLGQTTHALVTVQNLGHAAGSYTFILRVDSMNITKTVTLNSQETKTVDIPIIPAAAGTFTVRESTSGKSAQFTVVAAPVLVADIRVDKITVSPTQVNVGETVTITMTCTNYGTASGSKDISIVIN